MSTMRCTACGRPYKPSVHPAPYAAGAFAWVPENYGKCECGNNTFAGTVGGASTGRQPEAPALTAELRDTIEDALNGWRYIRGAHGDLYGIGWDRVEEKLTRALASTEAPAETPIAEVVGFNKVGFGQLPIVAWNKPPSLGDKLYAAPVVQDSEGPREEPERTAEWEREAFEKWADSENFCIHRDGTEKYRDYHRATTRFAWLAWKYRASITGAQPLQDPGKSKQEKT